jgi:hypothetical protein
MGQDVRSLVYPLTFHMSKGIIDPAGTRTFLIMNILFGFKSPGPGLFYPSCMMGFYIVLGWKTVDLVPF